MHLKIHLKMYSNSRGYPSCTISLNGNMLSNLISCKEEDVIIEYDELSLNDINFLHITHYDKKSNYTEVVNGNIISDVAVEVGKVEFDRIQFLEKCLWEQYFFPNWDNSANVKMPMTHNRYLGFNGTWQLVFPKNYKDFIVSQYISDKFL